MISDTVMALVNSPVQVDFIDTRTGRYRGALRARADSFASWLDLIKRCDTARRNDFIEDEKEARASGLSNIEFLSVAHDPGTGQTLSFFYLLSASIDSSGLNYIQAYHKSLLCALSAPGNDTSIGQVYYVRTGDYNLIPNFSVTAYADTLLMPTIPVYDSLNQDRVVVLARRKGGKGPFYEPVFSLHPNDSLGKAYFRQKKLQFFSTAFARPGTFYFSDMHTIYNQSDSPIFNLNGPESNAKEFINHIFADNNNTIFLVTRDEHMKKDRLFQWSPGERSPVLIHSFNETEAAAAYGYFNHSLIRIVKHENYFIETYQASVR